MERPPAITTILFDVGDVLIDNYDYVTNDVCQALGSPDGFDQRWPAAIHRYGSGTINRAAFWRELGCDHPTNAQQDSIVKGFRETLTIRNQVMEYAAHLATQGLRVGILSDTIPEHAEVLQQSGVYDEAIFDPCLLSYETGHRKPAPATYVHALGHLGLHHCPESVLFVDDRMKNIATAAATGMRTVHAVQRATQAETEATIINDIATKLQS